MRLTWVSWLGAGMILAVAMLPDAGAIAVRDAPSPAGTLIALIDGHAPRRSAQRAEASDPCALFTPAQAADVLDRPVGKGRVTSDRVSLTCEYATVGDETNRAALSFSVFRSAKPGMSGTAKSYYRTVREATWHIPRDERVDIKSVEGLGDDAFCVGGALHVVKGEDTYLTVSVSGSIGGADVEPTCGSSEDSRALALSRTIARMLLREP